MTAFAPRATRSLASFALFAAACSAQQVSLTRIIGDGDVLPGGQPYGGAGLAAIDGDRIVFEASPTTAEDAVYTYEIPTGELRRLVDTGTISPTYGEAFKRLGNPTIRGHDIVFPGAALVFTSEWEGLYHIDAAGGPVRTVVDETFPDVRIPSSPVLTDSGVLYRDGGYAGESVYFTTLEGALTVVAERGGAAPGGGSYFELEQPAFAAALAAYHGIISTSATNLWRAYAWNAAEKEGKLIVSQGDPIPDRAGETFDVVAALDSDGQQVLIGGDRGRVPDHWAGLYAWNGAALELLLEKGALIPGGGGRTFEYISGVAIDGDVLLFRGEDASVEIIGLYAIVDGRMIEILTTDTILPDGEVRNFNVTAQSLSGQRVVINVGFSPLGVDAIYLATIDAGCRADLDGDGELTFFDFLAFQNLFAARDPLADFNGDGVLDFFDFLAFQNEFAAGCE